MKQKIFSGHLSLRASYYQDS